MARESWIVLRREEGLLDVLLLCKLPEMKTRKLDIRSGRKHGGRQDGRACSSI